MIDIIKAKFSCVSPAKKALVDFLNDREEYLLALSRLEKKEPTISHDDFWSRVESELDRKV